MAFQASAPPLPEYQPLPGPDTGKLEGMSSCSGLSEACLGDIRTPLPQMPHGYIGPDPHHQHHVQGYVADPHHRLHSGYVIDPRHQHHHQSGYVADAHLHRLQPQSTPFSPQPDASVVFGFPVRPPASPPHWNTSLCGCCSDPAVCILGCFCPCILFGKIAENLDEGETSCLAACTIWYLLQQFTACGWLYSHGYRSKLRSRYGLTLRPCTDCIVHFCCWHCAFCQEYREIQIRRLIDEAAWERQAALAPPPQQVMRF
eukprot:c23881_g1_i1 orf=180-953(-)